MKKLLSIGLTLASLACLASCDKANSAADEKSFVSLDINPSVELVVEDGKVTNVYATNDDAKVLIYDEELVGKKFEEVVDKLIDLSVECGYLSAENTVVDFTVSSDDETEACNLETTVSTVVNGKEYGFDVTVSTSGVFSLLRELEAVKAAYPNNEDIQELTVGEFKIISSAMESDSSLDIEVAVTLDTTELVNHINEARDEFYNIANQAYEEMVVKSQIAYEEVLKATDRAAYTAFYTKNMVSHPVNYGLLYTMYGTASDAFNQIVVLTEVFNGYKNKALENEKVQEVVACLKEMGVTLSESLDELKDSNGNITMDSINAYVDKFVKNHNLTELEDLKASLNALEADVKAVCAKISEEYQPTIQAVLTTLETTKNQINMMVSLLPEALKTAINAYVAEIEAMVNIIKTSLEDGVSLDDVKGWVKDFEAKENEILTKIQEELTEEELAEIKATYDKSKAVIDEAKSKLDEAVNQAKTKVEEYFKAQKENK